MNLKNLHKQRIGEEILQTFGDSWSILVHDKMTVKIINSLFKKSDLIDFNISTVFSIGDERPKWDIPVIYFVNCTKEIAKTINSETKSGKYSSVKVFSLCEPEGLDPMIKCTKVDLNIKMIEERIFECQVEDIRAISYILNRRLETSSISSTQKAAILVENILKDTNINKEEAPLLVLDRLIDMYTPLMYFFSFRSMVSEIGNLDCSDEYFKEIRDLHIGEVSRHLQYTVTKLNESVKKLSNENLNISELDALVLEAPKNIDIKNNVHKYSEYLKKCFQRLEEIKDIAGVQQDLVLEKDKEGNKARISLDSFLSKIALPGLTSEDRTGLLYLLKVKGIVFTESEIGLLKSHGFSSEDIGMIFNRKSQILRNKSLEYKYEISRYEPILKDVIEVFIQNPEKEADKETNKVQSLRKTTMFSSETQSRRLIVVYIVGGLAIEEMKLAYLLSESFGIDLMIGSDKILNRREFVKEFKKNEHLQEKRFVKK